MTVESSDFSDWTTYFHLHVAITELHHSWKRNTAFLLITNSRNVENENAFVTWSILVINSYDAILVTFWCCLPVNFFCLVFETGLDRFQTGLTSITQNLLFHYNQEKLIHCILHSPISSNTNWSKHSLKQCLHYLVRASHDSGLFGTKFLFHEW